MPHYIIKRFDGQILQRSGTRQWHIKRDRAIVFYSKSKAREAIDMFTGLNKLRHPKTTSQTYLIVEVGLVDKDIP